MQSQPLTEQETHAIVCVCILAAFADGDQAEAERSQIERIVSGFPGGSPGLASAYQDVLTGKITLPQVAAELHSPASKTLAYEMAVCVCNADGVLKDPEKQFLSELRGALGLALESVETHSQTAQNLAAPPLIDPHSSNDSARDADVDRLILNTSVLAGALEIMPHTLATMAIVPVQVRMVYQVGKRYGFELDSGHIKDFLATVGIGLTSQVFEGFTRRLFGRVVRGVGGGLLGGLAAEAAGSAVAFASTYALGQVARQYYAGGRTLTTDQLKSVFSSMFNEARSLQGRYTGDIARKSQTMNVTDLVPLVRQR
ncbi:MAG TPA: DUF533 domain-containing protein [Verrucomicrobiae bacterium]|nr:DUF533 domain-containing protein [Verrucomicrobiae bacterium]